MLIDPTLKRGICCRRIRGESHRVVAGLLTEPFVPTGTVSVAGCSRLATGGLREWRVDLPGFHNPKRQ
jgi:hypothetical protein